METKTTPVLFKAAEKQLDAALRSNEIQRISHYTELITNTLVGVGCEPIAAKKTTIEFVNFMKNEKNRTLIANATPHSVIGCLAVAAQNGYSISGVQTPDAYLIPYNEDVKDENNVITKRPILSLTLSYKGIMNKCPTILNFEPHIIREGEIFVTDVDSYGDMIIKQHVRKVVAGNYGKGDFKGVYGYLVLAAPGVGKYKTAIRMLSVGEVEKLRKNNRGQKDTPSDAWHTSYEEMAAIKLLRKLLKFIPSIQLPKEGVFMVNDNNEIESDANFENAEVENPEVEQPQPELTDQEKADEIAKDWKLQIFNILEKSSPADFIPTRKVKTPETYTYLWGHAQARELFSGFMGSRKNDAVRALAYADCSPSIIEMITAKEVEFVTNTKPKDPKTAYNELNPA